MSIYKPKSHVAFDIDGIVLDTGTEIWRVVTSHYDIPASIEMWKEYYIEQQFGISVKELRTVYEPVLHRTDLPLIEGAAEVLRNFYEITKEPILFITARRPQFVQSAIASMKKKLPEIPMEVVATSEAEALPGDDRGHNKVQYLLDHEIQLFIDDHPDSWEGYIDAGVCIGTLDWPWTRNKAKLMNKKRFKMFKNWKDIGEFLDLGLRTQQLFDEMRSWPTV